MSSSLHFSNTTSVRQQRGKDYVAAAPQQKLQDFLMSGNRYAITSGDAGDDFRRRWLSAEGMRLLDLVQELPSERKKRLFACACCRLVWRYLANPRSSDAIESSERYADGLENKDDMKKVRRRSASVARGDVRGWEAKHFAADAATCAASVDISAYLRVIVFRVRSTLEVAGGPAAAQTDVSVTALIRDIFGNPVRPVVMDLTWLTWNRCTVPKIAETIYAERSFHHLPIMADALEEAGCADAEVLSHCRGSGSHTRGCWVLDRVLGKS